tara:strand:- start:605 stop:1768 length:1164 start_codon:yes stop_codon:yes gene_type:complete
MSVEDMNYASAMSEGSNMTRSVSEHNEAIRENNQLLAQGWNQTINNDQDKRKEDKYIQGGEDAYGSITAVASIGDAINRIQTAGGIGAAFKADAQAVADKFTGAKNYVSKLVSGNPEEAAKAGSKSVGDSDGSINPTKQAANPTETTESPIGEERLAQLKEQSPAFARLKARSAAGVDVTKGGGATPLDAEGKVLPVKPIEPTANPQPSEPPPDSKPTDPSGTTTDESVVSKTAVTEGSSAEELSSSVMKGLKTAGTVGRVAGIVGGVVGLVGGIHDIADGTFAKEDTAHTIGSVLQDAGGILDVASVFMPVLAPLAAVTNVASAIDSTVNTLSDDTARTGNDVKSAATQAANNNKNMEVSPAFASMSIIGSARTSAKASIAGTSSF